MFAFYFDCLLSCAVKGNKNSMVAIERTIFKRTQVAMSESVNANGAILSMRE